MACENVGVMHAPAAASLHCGGPATGKTAALVERARAYEAADTLFVCASKASAADVRARLEGAGIEVLDIAQLACQVLDDEEVLERFGRGSHVLNKAERGVLMEDLKVYGSKRRRLRELLGFLERGFSDLADDDPDWVKTTEEEDVLALLFGNLEFSQGVLPSEASALAYKGVRGSEAVRARHARKHVLVDDFEFLGRASQALVCALAQDSLDVAAGDVPGVPVLDPFPHAAGVEELLAANPQISLVQLRECARPAAIVATLNALRADEALAAGELTCDEALAAGELTCDEALAAGEAGASVNMQTSEGVVPEFAAVTAELRRAIDAGSKPERLFVACVNPMWRANLKRYLQQAGVPVAKASRPAPSTWMRALIAEGDPLSASVQVARLREIAQPQGLHLEEALQAFANGRLEGARADDPLLEGLADAYLKAAGGRAVENDGLRESSTEQAGAGVAVGEPFDVLGRTFDEVVFSGFVNGFIPSADYCDPGKVVGGARRRAHAADIQAVYRLAGAAEKRIVLTGFSACGLEAAERLKLHIARIRLRQGVRTCDIEPSELAAYIVEG